MTQNKENILNTIRRNKDKITILGVRRLGLFGSFVRKEQNIKSDIDILVEFDPDRKTFDNFMNLYSLLEEILKYHIELVTSESLSPYIKPHIMKEVEYAISRP